MIAACMRLRKLGQGQSLMFVAPPEVDQSIKSVTGNRRVLIDGYDVLAWSLEQSCLSIERSQPLRVLQGLGHYLRQKKWDAFVARYPNFDDVAREIKATQPLIAEFMEKEEHELVDLYAPPALRTKKLPTMIDSCRNDPDPLVQELISIWRNTLSTICEAASMHDEHEREVAHEVELETQIQRPPRVKALDTSVSGPLRAFVRTGNPSLMMSFHDAYTQVAEKTSARSSGPVKLLRGLKTTSDFANTVERPQSGYYDSYLRSVNWILTSKAKMSPAELLVISQYELNQLYEAILSKTSKVRLHIYEPRVTKSMRSIDFAPPYQISPSVWDWRYVSSELRRELHLFAGQLYFNTYDEYRGLCTSLAAETNVNVEKLLTFIKAWTVIRRKGQDFLPTHVGQMVSNRTIKEEAFS